MKAFSPYNKNDFYYIFMAPTEITKKIEGRTKLLLAFPHQQLDPSFMAFGEFGGSFF